MGIHSFRGDPTTGGRHRRDRSGLIPGLVCMAVGLVILTAGVLRVRSYLDADTTRGWVEIAMGAVCIGPAITYWRWLRVAMARNAGAPGTTIYALYLAAVAGMMNALECLLWGKDIMKTVLDFAVVLLLVLTAMHFQRVAKTEPARPDKDRSCTEGDHPQP